MGAKEIAAKAGKIVQVAVSATLTPVDALVKIVRFIAAHNTVAALEYAGSMTPFLTITVKQRVQVHNAAVSLLAAGRKIELGSGKGRRDPTEADVASMNQDAESLQLAIAAAAKEGREPRFVTVHQRYAPLVNPLVTDESGKVKHYKALTVAYTELVESGKIAPKMDYIAAVKEGEARKILEQRATKGGYLVAVAADAAANREANKAAPKVKTSSAGSSLDMLA